jgi:hypothetical protein
MNFISDITKQLNGAPLSHSEIVEKDQAQGVSSCLRLLDWAAKSNDPEGQLLYAALLQRIKQPVGDKKTLEHALGLASTGQGHVSAFTKVKTELRNRYLSRAVKHLEQQHNCSIWAACGLLAETMQTFRAIKFKRIQAGSRGIYDGLEQHLFDVFMIDDRPPTTQSYLYEIFIKLQKVDAIDPS